MHPGDPAGQLRGGCGEHFLPDRAGSDGMRPAEDLRHLRGGSGASHGHGRASTLSSGVQPECFKGTCLVEVVKFVHKFGLRKALMMYIMEIGLGEHRIHLTVEMHASAGIHGMVEEGDLEEVWSHSQCLGRVAEISAAPKPTFQIFRPWPVRSNLETGSTCADRSWDLTQAQTHYGDWKQATPLQRVQIDPRPRDELHERCYDRTEQCGVNLLLKAVSSEVQQMLVRDRQLTSTAILYRLYVRYQPGGPGEKTLILQELTKLPKTNNMAELSAALRSWRRHF